MTWQVQNRSQTGKTTYFQTDVEVREFLQRLKDLGWSLNNIYVVHPAPEVPADKFLGENA